MYALDAIGDRFTEMLDTFEEATPSRIMKVGRSCGAKAAPVSYLDNIDKGQTAIIWFDAHGDLNTPESSPSGHFHGMVLRTLLGEGPNFFLNEYGGRCCPRRHFLLVFAVSMK
ncbi:MAG: arginase family protein [Kangiellaceae bacterium]|nr:arginase family protein [Kangiellaceae bacterium]